VLLGWRLSAVVAVVDEWLRGAARQCAPHASGWSVQPPSAWVRQAHHIPVIDCRRGERKHDLAEDYLAEHAVGRGLFMILVGRAVAPVWDVQRSSGGGIHLTKKLPYINHYSFHIMDAQWGHITIKMAGHPPFGTQIILNGHEYVACGATKRQLTFTKEDNCFTQIADAADLARIADTLSEARTVGRLVQVCERWIYSACLCFGLGIKRAGADRLPLRLLGVSSRIQPQPAVPAGQSTGASLSVHS